MKFTLIQNGGDLMVSVTQRIKQVKQPRGGYIHPRDFTVTDFEDDTQFNKTENIHAITVGLAVDYLTRYLLGALKEEAFKTSLLGAHTLDIVTEKIKSLEQRNVDELNTGYKSFVNSIDEIRNTGDIKLESLEDLNQEIDIFSANLKSLKERSQSFISQIKLQNRFDKVNAKIDKEKFSKELLDGIKDLDDQSIINACQLSGFDVVFRAGPGFYKPVEEIKPDKDTIENIRIMVKRGIIFLKSTAQLRKTVLI